MDNKKILIKSLRYKPVFFSIHFAEVIVDAANAKSCGAAAFEEIFVTAQKRSRRASDLDLSIEAMASKFPAQRLGSGACQSTHFAALTFINNTLEIGGGVTQA